MPLRRPGIRAKHQGASACIVSVLESDDRLRNPPVEHYDIACTQDFQFLVQVRKTHHRSNDAPASHFRHSVSIVSK